MQSKPEYSCCSSRTADPIKKYPGCYKIYWAILPLCTVAAALKAMCNYCGAVIGGVSNPNLYWNFNVLNECRLSFKGFTTLYAL